MLGTSAINILASKVLESQAPQKAYMETKKALKLVTTAYLLYIMIRLARKAGQVDRAGFWRTQQADSCNNSQCPLSSNKKLLQIIAGVVLPERLQQVQNRSVRNDSLYS